MKKIPLLILLCFALGACNEKAKDSTLETESTKYAAINLQIQNPTIVDGSDWVIYPLAFDEAKKFSKNSSYAGLYGYWNVVFYNTESKQSRLLSDDLKMAIHSISAANKSTIKREQQNDKYKELIYYSITTDDYNQDGKIDSYDPRYLFISDLSGQGFKQISPHNSNLIHWEIIHKTNKVLIQVQADSNDNKKFDDADEIVPFVFDIDSQQLEAVFDPEFNLKTKKLFDTHWENKQ